MEPSNLLKFPIAIPTSCEHAIRGRVVLIPLSIDTNKQQIFSRRVKDKLLLNMKLGDGPRYSMVIKVVKLVVMEEVMWENVRDL